MTASEPKNSVASVLRPAGSPRRFLLRAFRSALAVAFAVLLTQEAVAQSGNQGPIRLTPPGLNGGQGGNDDGGQAGTAPAPNEAPAAGGTSGSGSGSDGGSSGGFQTIAPSTPRQGIQIRTLAQPSIETVGVLTDATGGLGFDLWEGSQRGIVLGLMRRLPGDLDSYDGRQLAQRLLLTDAAPPESGAEHENVELLLARVERLRALGDSRGLLRLLSVAPSDLVARKLARPRVEAELLEGDYAGACLDTRSRADFTDAPDFWQKALIFCQIHAGEIPAAQLGLQLMAELPSEGTGAFLAMGRRMLDGLGALPEKIGPNAPDLAMADLLGESLPPGFLPLETPGFAQAALRLSGLPPEERARAAEIAADRRLVGPSAVTRAYKEIPFTGEQLDAALTLAPSQPSHVGRALLYQAAARSKNPEVKAEMLLNVLESAEADGQFQAIASAFAGQLQALPPRPDLAWFASTAGRALYALGRYEQASEWLELARREAVTSPQAQASVTLLWPYALMAGDGAADWDGSLMAWSLARNEGAGELADMQAQLTSSFRALGMGGRVEAESLARKPYGSGVTPDFTNLPALRDASLAGRRGETLLLAALALGPNGTREVHPEIAEAVLQALRAVGLPAEARALAIEMALNAGI